MKNFYLLIFLTTFCMLSCSDDDIRFENNQTSLNRSTELRRESDFESTEQIILGNKRTNPFSIENINTAARDLYGESDFIPTHDYIKIFPTTQEHLVDLNEWAHKENLAVFDYPLDYEIAVPGDYYVDPEVSDPVFTYQYAVVPKEGNLPNVPFNVLEEIYLDQSQPFVLAQSFKNTGHEEAITADVLYGGIRQSDLENIEGLEYANAGPRIECPDGCEAVLVIDDTSFLGDEVVYVWECDCTSDGNNDPPVRNDCGCKVPSDDRFPAGCVQVEAKPDEFDGVKIAKIKLKNNWYSSDIVYTNARGCWAHGEKYSNRISMQVIFENENLKVRNTTYWLGIRVTKSPKRMINNPPYNNILTQFDDKEDRREWACSHTLNTDYEYRQAVVIDGVPLPRTRINYLLKPGDGDASAAMLQNNPFNSWLAFLVAMKFPIGTLLTTGLQPDITNQYALKENYKSFKDVTVHELGHASHYSLVGESYWIGYRDHIIINDGYGDFGSFKVGSSPGKVALGEAIGNYAQVTYGYINRNPEKSTFENGFIPDGLMYDLEDSNQDPITDPITSTIIQDKVSGFTPAMIFNALRPNVVNINSFGNRLRSLHLNDTNNNFNDFNNLIDVYDVFN